LPIVTLICFAGGGKARVGYGGREDWFGVPVKKTREIIPTKQPEVFAGKQPSTNATIIFATVTAVTAHTNIPANALGLLPRAGDGFSCW